MHDDLDSTTDAGASPHVISATNFLFGATNFFVVPLPPDCRLTPGLGAPDVESNVEHAGCRWVTNGRAHYLVYDPPRHLCLELAIRVRRWDGRSLDQSTDTDISICGHDASYRFGSRPIGLFRRTRLTTLAVTIPCPQTRRLIHLELAGRCGVDDLERFREAMRGLQCH